MSSFESLEPRDGRAAESARRWRVALFGNRRVSAVSSGETLGFASLFGDQKVDLRAMTSGGVDVLSLGVFGDLEVEVPPNSRVQIDGITLFGDIEEPPAAPPNDHQLVVRIRRFSLFGDVEIDSDDDD